MLRAGKSINISKDHLHSHHGVLLSPVINFSGLILRADRPIPEAMKHFLASHHVEVKRVRYQGELHVRLRGNYSLSKMDVEAFIAEHTDLIHAQQHQLDDVPVARRLQQEIANNIDHIQEPLSADANGQEYTFKPTIMAGNTVKLNVAKAYANTGGRLASRLETTIHTASIINQGTQLNTIGFFADISSKGNINIHSQASQHENAVVDAGESLSLEPNTSAYPSEENLTLDPRVTWLNNPHPECLAPLTLEPVNTQALLEEADDVLMKLSMGAIL